MTRPLIERLEAKSAELTERVLLEMWSDPFWQERFGDRGRRHMAEDGNYHLSYVKQALLAGDADVMARYARWLQSVLVSRGMCSLHLADNFDRLARAISQEVADSRPAVDMLSAGREALLHERGPGRELQERAAVIVDAAITSLRDTSVIASPTDLSAEGHEGLRHALLHHVSYLADALALSRPELFLAHVDWHVEFLGRRDVPRARLRTVLESVDAQVRRAAHVSHDLRDAAHELIARALERLPNDGSTPTGGHA